MSQTTDDIRRMPRSGDGYDYVSALGEMGITPGVALRYNGDVYRFVKLYHPEQPHASVQPLTDADGNTLVSVHDLWEAYHTDRLDVGAVDVCFLPQD